MLKIENPSSSSSQQQQQTVNSSYIKYDGRLNLYKIPPPYELNIEQFETLALNRLVILKAIETATIRNSLSNKNGEYNQNVLKIVKENLPLASNNLLKQKRVGEHVRNQIRNERKNDHISHFILRLAFCQTEDLRNWFIKLETDLFKLRLSEEDSQQVDMLIEKSNFDIIEKDKLPKQVQGDLFQMLPPGVTDIEPRYFKVPFHTVCDMVRQRKVVVRGGIAYLPRSVQSTLLVSIFKDKLASDLDALAKHLPSIDADELVAPILTSIAKQHLSTSKSYVGETNGKFTHADIDGLVRANHFAPCMKNLHVNLKRDAHLKHFGRLQYGLFIKAIGLPYEEALTFWRKAFHKLDDDKFQKGYAYNIRHSYGLEGKRTNYTAYSCLKIITSNQPGSGDHHGCPFKHFSGDNLKPMLVDYISSATSSAPSSSIVQQGVNEVSQLARGGHYQVACTRLFELSHQQQQQQKGEGGGVQSGNGEVETIEHPNQYFELSYYGVNNGKRRGQSDDNGDGDDDNTYC